VSSVSDALRAQAKVVAVSGALIGAAASFAPPGLIFRENRIVNGEPLALVTALGAWGPVLLAVWIAVAAVAMSPWSDRLRGTLATLLGGAAPVIIAWGSGVEAHRFVETNDHIARTSLGWAVWLSLFAAYAVIFAATAWLQAGAWRTVLTYLPVAGVAALLVSGSLAELAVMREYANNADSFWREFRLHLSYVAGAVGVGLVTGVSLGLLAARRRPVEPAVFGALNVLQVLPTLAFIGLMNPVLTALSSRFPALAGLGVRGVGWAPVIIVLSAYAVYPIARNTYTAIISLDPAVIDAGRGVGMSRLRLFAEVEVPLALPVVVAGVRIALVQSTAGAIIAGLVGGGGLGVFVFLGASETATDLILLGVIPIVALALFFDRTVLALQRAVGSWRETG
jgi:osmoprotectant transport system permease protein